MKLKRYIYAILLGCAITSCDDFLTENPPFQYTQESSVFDYNSSKNAVNGIYGKYEQISGIHGALYENAHCRAGLWQYDMVQYNMSYTQSNFTDNDAWKGFYNCINAANAAINGIEKVDDKKFPSLEEKERLIAEARCFRGYCNLQLLWNYGHWFADAASPYGIIYRDQVANMANLMVDRSSVGDSYQYILDDLNYAEEYLNDYVSARYLSKQFAKVMHAKLLLVRGWDGDYAEALALVNDVMSTSPAHFQMESDLSNLYEKCWDSNEVLFSRYMGDLTSLGRSEFTYSYGLYYDNKFEDIPQQWLEEDERASIIFGEARAPETWDTSRKGNVLVKLYHRGQYEGLNDRYGTYVFRYAELYLMKAELLARTNPSDISGALKPLNDMRATYTNPIMEPVRGIDTYDKLMDAIYKEYVVTLFMENETPWFASLRFMHNGEPWIKTLKPDINFSENQYCLPIPDDEIIAHTNKIEQNPGLK